MKIFTEIKNSIGNKEYYRALPTNETLGSSIKYLAKICLLASLLAVIVFMVGIPVMTKTFKGAMSEAVANFPDDLVVTIQNGTASVNRPEPYIVPLSLTAQIKALKDGSINHENIVVIDTTKQFSVDQFNAFSTNVWVTKTELAVAKESTGEIRIIPLSKFGDHEITKPWILKIESLIIKYLPLIFIVLAVMFYIGLFISLFVGNIIGLFIYAFVIWLMAKIKKVELSYKNSYKIGAHAITLLLALKMLSMIGFLSFLDNFILKLIILIAVVYINFFSTPKISVKPAI